MKVTEILVVIGAHGETEDQQCQSYLIDLKEYWYPGGDLLKNHHLSVLNEYTV